MSTKLPIILAIILYLLIYWIRYQQPPFEPKLDLFSGLRASLDQRIQSHLPSPEAQLLSGIILGNKKDLPPEFKIALRDTSTLHIVVVSGQNLSLLTGLFLPLIGLLKKRTVLLISILAVILYTLLTGAEVPVIRAAIMASLAFMASFFGREKEGVWLLSLTAALMLLVNPRWILDLSFQLSFLATAGVIVVAPALFKFFNKIPLLGADLAVTVGAQLLIIPIIAQNFHQISIVGILANLLVVWTIPFIMGLGALSLLLPFTIILVEVMLRYFVYIVSFFANLPFAWEYIGEKLWIVWVGYYLLLSGVLLLIYGQEKDFRRS